jgi:hypothetical protein
MPTTPATHEQAAHEQPPRARKRRWWLAPFRWIRKAASALLRPLRASIIKRAFSAMFGRDRGFGFWWLVATLALAVAIGLILAVVLSPVLGLLAAIGVSIWMLVRRSRSSDSDEDDESGQADANDVAPSAAAW